MKITNKDFVPFNNDISFKENLCNFVKVEHGKSMLDGIIDADRVDAFVEEFLQSESDKILSRLKKKIKKSGGIGKVAE